VVAYSDKMLTCRDCGVTFVFTAGEQEFYAQKGFTNEPGRCPACRAARRASGMGAGRGGLTAGDAAGEPRRLARELHETVCASCGGVARVPFIPRGDRPVYCSTCFERVRS